MTGRLTVTNKISAQLMHCQKKDFSAGILKQTVGAWKPSRNWVVAPSRQATKVGGIDSLEAIPGLLKSLETPSLHGHWQKISF